MSTLMAAYPFNEYSCHDYSGKGFNLTATGVTFGNTTATNNGFGADAIFNGGTNYLTGRGGNFSLVTGFTCFMNVNLGNLNYILSQILTTYSIKVNSSGKVVFTASDSTATDHTLTSTATLSTGTWYTIGCVWDGSYLYIYINGALDSTLSVSFTNLGTSDYGIAIGEPGFSGRINMLEIRNAAMSASQIYSLNNSPGGTACTVDIHNFFVGDLIADPDVVNQGVVTFIVDQSNFMYYPLAGSNTINPCAKYGNVFNSNRQTVMEISNDFDGYGNSQLSIKTGINSFARYLSPLGKITLDHNGLTGAENQLANMMALTSLRI